MGSQGRLALLNLAGLVFAVAGSLLLLFALTLKPSNYRLVKAADGTVTICLDNKKVEGGYGGPLVVSNEDCPDMQEMAPLLRWKPTIRVLHTGEWLL
jgi:hypothetical protein